MLNESFDIETEPHGFHFAQLQCSINDYCKSCDVRSIDALTGLWRTLEWLHGETGIGFGLDKPLLLLVSSDVVMEGLPGYMANTGKQPTLSFNPLDLDGLRPRIDAIMPSFRDWISGKKSQEFWNAIAGPSLLLLIGGIFGFAIGSSRK